MIQADMRRTSSLTTTKVGDVNSEEEITEARRIAAERTRRLEKERIHIRRTRTRLVSGLMTLDILMILVGFWLAYYFRFDAGISGFNLEVTPRPEVYIIIILVMLPVLIILFRSYGLYEIKNIFSGTKEYGQIFNACSLGMMLVIFTTFILDEINIARGWLVLSWVFMVFFIEVGRFFARRIVQHLRTKGHFNTSVLIVGANEEGQAIASQLQMEKRAGIRIIGFVDDNLKPGTEILPDTFVLGPIDSLEELVYSGGLQELIIPVTALPRERLLNIFRTFAAYDELTIRMSSGLYELITTGVEVQKVGNVPLLSINKLRLTGLDRWLKSALDLTISLAVLPALLMVAIPIAIIIRLESSGPIFHRRRVIGVGAKQFDAFKFRTMYVDGDKRLSPEERVLLEQHGKLKHDPRITKIGRILRPTSLDELPQIINVIKGEMSLVGPRMITYEEQVKYGKWRTNLVTVKPGITGLWQVSGRSDLSYEDRVMLDMQYIRNYSIWFDIHLLWRTIPAVLAKRGAY